MSSNKTERKKPFSERYPKLNMVISVVIVVGFFTIAIEGAIKLLQFLGQNIIRFANWLTTLASSFDAVVIVALITGAVSITGVIISSIVAKSIDYKKTRREYLAKKREAPYGEFVEMIYRVQESSKEGHDYPQEELIKDLMSFSKQITLWGSSAVVNDWVKFKETAIKGTEGLNNLLLTEKIMNDMRKDLGLKKTKKGNLLAFFVNDIKDAMKNQQKR
ncbi:MAG: hypothetical protein IKB36_03700 [Clostridia bacterium]|nr:hypothetical protein [Clostridia bacterium]